MTAKISRRIKTFDRERGWRAATSRVSSDHGFVERTVEDGRPGACMRTSRFEVRGSRFDQKHRRRLRNSGAPTMQTWNSVCGDTRREPDQPQARGYHGRNATQAFLVRLAKELRRPCPDPREGLRTHVDVRREVGGEGGETDMGKRRLSALLCARSPRIYTDSSSGGEGTSAAPFARFYAALAKATEAGSVSFRAPTPPGPGVPDLRGRGRRGWYEPRQATRRPETPRTCAQS